MQLRGSAALPNARVYLFMGTCIMRTIAQGPAGIAFRAPRVLAGDLSPLRAYVQTFIQACRALRASRSAWMIAMLVAIVAWLPWTVVSSSATSASLMSIGSPSPAFASYILDSDMDHA